MRTVFISLNRRCISAGFVFNAAAGVLTLSALAAGAFAQSGPRPDNKHASGLPPEAYSSCQNLAPQEVCTVQTPHGTLVGTCGSLGNAPALACLPDRGEDNRRGPRPDRREPSEGAERPDGGAPPPGHPLREHKVTQSSGVPTLIAATEDPIAPNIYDVNVDGAWRTISANSIAKHKTGIFPNPGNPNMISEQSLKVRVPAKPELTEDVKFVKVPGYAINGVEFDPGAGEFYRGDAQSGWQYEAMSGAIALGLDENHAHVQPQGKYHYHGLPSLLLADEMVSSTAHSPQIGWAVDGFPIYARFGYENSQNVSAGITELRSSYRLRAGARPGGEMQPGGTYDGTFTADYEYVKGSGDLDECNAKWTVTPEYPGGTYAYFLTQEFPYVPRCVKGKVERQRRR